LEDEGIPLKKHKPEAIVAKLRQVDVLLSQGQSVAKALRSGLSKPTVWRWQERYATHKTPEVMAWLEQNPRFNLHFTPTSASWLNLVERFFAEITAKRIRRDSYSSVDDLEDAI
jgi:transposase